MYARALFVVVAMLSTSALASPAAQQPGDVVQALPEFGGSGNLLLETFTEAGRRVAPCPGNPC